VDGWCVEFLVTILRGHQTCPAVGVIPARQDKTRNTPMIDPPKATKGRRMSKKTRKKSPKPSSGKAAAARSVTSAKKPPSKTLKATASKSGKNATRQTANATRGASHKAPSKQLKSPGATAPKGPARAKPTAAKPQAGNPPLSKPPGGKANAPAAGKSALAEGAKAPAFRLPRDGGSTVSLADFAGKKLVLFFYPRADTPGCTKEAIDFTRLAGAFADSGAAILGVSADPPKTQEAFRDKHQLSTPLLSDEQHEMLEAYGAWGEKSMYGRTFHGILRTTVLVGADGRIIRIWRHVKVDGHADDVLAAVRGL
jgi:thioredoxin-dependent peroxiredoxin